MLGRHPVQTYTPPPKLGRSHSSMVFSCTVAFGDTWPNAPRHPQPLLCIPRPDHLQKALNASKQKLKIKMFHNTHPKDNQALQGQQEPKLLALVRLTLANLRSPLRAVLLKADSPRSLGLGQQMPPGVIPFPIGKGRIGPSVPTSWPEGPYCLFSTYAPHTPLITSIPLVAWFLLKAFYISHS